MCLYVLCISGRRATGCAWCDVSCGIYLCGLHAGACVKCACVEYSITCYCQVRGARGVYVVCGGVTCLSASVTYVMCAYVCGVVMCWCHVCGVCAWCTCVRCVYL